MISLRTEVVDLEDAVSTRTEARKSDGRNLLSDGIPEGGVPGPILSEVLTILESEGIHNYEYRVQERLSTNSAGDGNDNSDRSKGRNDESRDEQSAAWNETAWDDDADEDEADRNGDDLESTPGLSLYHWKIELTLRTPYDRTVEFLTAIGEAPRHWRTSELDLTREGRTLEVVLLLETFTRPVAGASESEEVGPRAFNNPFRARQGGPTGGPIPAAPDLRAIMSGAEPRAWIGGEILTTGETVAQWTVEEIDDDGVWIRHKTGQRRRLSVES